MIQRIGMLTGGGDCPGLNAAIRGVVRSAAGLGWEVLGIRRGFEGLNPPTDTMPLTLENTAGILNLGGTILGAANQGAFTAKTGHGQSGRLPPELIEKAKRSLADLKISALVAAGGDGTLSIAQQFYEAGVPVVGVPKTIDNDLDVTVATFGFDSAVACATDALDRLHTTASSHGRVFVLEVMGRYAGWIALHSGIAGGADVVLIPEVPFCYEAVAKHIELREKSGRRFMLVVAAEGAKPKDGDFAVKGTQAKDREARLGGIGERVAEEIHRRTGKECRTVVLGHLQRGGTPTTFDRLLATRYGVAAVRMIEAGQFGMMAALKPPDIVPVPILEAVGRLRQVPPEGNLVLTARALGVSLGSPSELNS
jgi:6-phosphofructokinase 1